MDEKELALRYLALFRGYSKCFGQFTAAGQLTSHKVTGSAETIKRAPDVNDVLAHLKGTKRMGMIPLRDDNSVNFCAIDHDAYKENINHELIARQIINLPLILTKSKSGGAHLWMFSKTPLPAAKVIKCLRHWVNELGWSPKTEVFPKQSERAGATDIGNWINLPYFGWLSDAPQCTALVASKADATCHVLTLEEFLTLAENATPPDKYVEDAALKVRSKNPKSSEILFADGPPCIQSILEAASKEGWSEGSRNNTLWHIAVYLSKQGHDESKLLRKLEDMNKTNWEFQNPIRGEKDKYETLTVPPVGLQDKEIAAIARSASRKDYGYKCQDEPMKGLCNHSLCKLRTWGVGSGGRKGELENAITSWVTIKGNPAHWYFSYGDVRVHIKTARDLANAKAFKIAVMNATGLAFPDIPEKVFGPMITEFIENGDMREAPSETQTRVQVQMYLAQFIVDNPGDSMEDVTKGKAYEHEDGYIYMRGDPFYKYLARNNSELSRIVSRNEMLSWLEEDMNLEYGNELQPRIKGKQTRVWRLPAENFLAAQRAPSPLPGDVM